MRPATRMIVLAGWGVHLYTALGVVAGLGALVAITSEDPRALFLWLAVALAIDSSDGALARLARVKQHIPEFDGAKLDDIVDYLTYVLVPIFFLVHTGSLTGGLGMAVAGFALVASAYRFCHEAAKTADYFFTGFPSYWNVVALYLYVFETGPFLATLLIGTLAAFVFSPIRFVYPSRTPTLRPLTLTLGVIWGVMAIALIAALPERRTGLAALSLFYPLYYTLLSFYLHRREGRAS